MTLYDPELSRLTTPHHEPRPDWMVAAIIIALVMLLVGMWHNAEADEPAPAVHPTSWRTI